VIPCLVLLSCKGTYERLVETMRVAVAEVVMVLLMQLDQRIQREVQIIPNRWSSKRDDEYSARFITTASAFVRKSGLLV